MNIIRMSIVIKNGWQNIEPEGAAIGEPIKVIEIQPVEVPIPKKSPAPAPKEQPVKEPVGA